MYRFQVTLKHIRRYISFKAFVYASEQDLVEAIALYLETEFPGQEIVVVEIVLYLIFSPFNNFII